jgi:hypothetical protein
MALSTSALFDEREFIGDLAEPRVEGRPGPGRNGRPNSVVLFSVSHPPTPKDSSYEWLSIIETTSSR